jgi:hypothetical protein
MLVRVFTAFGAFLAAPSGYGGLESKESPYDANCRPGVH